MVTHIKMQPHPSLWFFFVEEEVITGHHYSAHLEKSLLRAFSRKTNSCGKYPRRRSVLQCFWNAFAKGTLSVTSTWLD
jgi:hypothetical protein